jgi:extradiol dioxygenase family protein
MESEKRLIFHLAVPCDDLDAAEAFYVDTLGFDRGRRHDEHVIFDFFGHQLVSHLSPEDTPDEPEMYPRHLGIVFEKEDNYEKMLNRVEDADVDFFEEPFRRLEGKSGEHRSFFIADPSNNLIEFKYYDNSGDIY